MNTDFTEEHYKSFFNPTIDPNLIRKKYFKKLPLISKYNPNFKPTDRAVYKFFFFINKH